MKTNEVAQAVRDYFSFDVQKLPLRGPDNLLTPHYGLFRSDNGDCIPVAVTAKHKPHTTDDVVALAEASAMSFDCDVEVNCSWFKTGHRVQIRPGKAYRKSVYGSNDNVWPSIIIRGDYGGTFIASCGMYRDACRNLAVIRRADGITVSIAHRGDFRDKMNTLIDDFRGLAAKFDNVYEIAVHLNERRVAIRDFLNGAVQAPAEDASKNSHTRYENKIQKILERLSRERQLTGRPDANDFTGDASLWEMANAVTGYLQHDAQVRGTLTASDRAFRAADSSECDRIWDFAITLAG